jgi:hypothetical protein
MTRKEKELATCNEFMSTMIAVNEDFIYADKYNSIKNKYLSKDKTLALLIKTGLIEPIKDDRYILSVVAGSYMIKTKGMIFELPNKIRRDDINADKFRKKLIHYLNKQPKKRVDISNFINSAINKSDKRKMQVSIELDYLEHRKIIQFYNKDGPFLGHNAKMGDVAVGILAGLTNEYLDKSWMVRHPFKWQIILWIVPPVITFFIGKYTGCNTPQKTTADSTKSIPAQGANSQKQNANTTKNGNSQHSVDTLSH